MSDWIAVGVVPSVDSTVYWGRMQCTAFALLRHGANGAFDEDEEPAKLKRVSLAQSDERMTVQRIDTLVTWYVLLMRDF